MTLPFGRGFEERAELQRRQIYHQRILEAQSFKYEPQIHDHDIPAGARAWSLGIGCRRATGGGDARASDEMVIGRLGPGIRTRLHHFVHWNISYLGVTAVIGFCVHLFHEPVAHPGFGNQMAGAIVELREPSLTSWLTLSVPLLMAALATLHGPGLLVCARVLAQRIEEPYEDGFRGLLIAWAVSLTVMPMALLATSWQLRYSIYDAGRL